MTNILANQVVYDLAWDCAVREMLLKGERRSDASVGLCAEWSLQEMQSQGPKESTERSRKGGTSKQRNTPDVKLSLRTLSPVLATTRLKANSFPKVLTQTLQLFPAPSGPRIMSQQFTDFWKN